MKFPLLFRKYLMVIDVLKNKKYIIYFFLLCLYINQVGCSNSNKYNKQSHKNLAYYLDSLKQSDVSVIIDTVSNNHLIIESKNNYSPKTGFYLEKNFNRDSYTLGKYNNGIKTGKWFEGQGDSILITYIYINGKKNGPSYTFLNDKISGIDNFNNNYFDGKNIGFDNQGNIVGESIDKNGRTVWAKYYYPDFSSEFIYDTTFIKNIEYDTIKSEENLPFKLSTYVLIKQINQSNTGQKEIHLCLNISKNIWRFETYFSNGNKADECTYINSKEFGISKYWFENGQLESQCMYKNDKKNGIEKKWLENGKLYSNGMYINNFKDGKWIYNYDGPNGYYGEIVDEVYYSRGIEIKERIIYEDGHSIWQYY